MSLRILFICVCTIILASLEIHSQSLHITDIQPKNGTPGTKIEIWGSGFSFGTTSNKVTFIPADGGSGTIAGVSGVAYNSNYNIYKLSVTIPNGLKGGNYKIVVENLSNSATDTLPTLFPVTTGGGYFGELGSNKKQIASLNNVIANDINGDGHIDLVGSDNNQLHWAKNDGSYNPTFSKISLPYPYLNGPSSFHITDLDDDGDLDIIGNFYSSTNYLLWYENDGALSPTFTKHTLSSENFGQLIEIDSRDIDNDGDIDIVAISEAELLLFTNNGEGTPTFSKSVIKTVNGTTDRFRSLYIFDQNSGYRMSIITGTTSGTIAIHKNLGNGSFDIDETIVTTNGSIVSDITVADVGYGGNLDIISSSSSYSSSKIAWYNSAGSHAETTLNSSVNRPEAIFAGDFDGDGDYDIISNSRLNSSVFMYESNGAATSYFTERTISTSENDTYIMTAADLDNDGDLDILTSKSGSVYWYENMDPPLVSKSALFDGVGDYIEIADDNALDLTNGFTIEGWIKPTNLDSDFQRLLSKTDAYGVGVNNSTIRYTNYSVKDYDLSYTLSDDTWVHIATVIDASNTVTFYVNGQDVGSISSGAGSANTSSYPLIIGNNSNDNEAFNGHIDELRIWDDERTQHEIQMYMYESLVGDESNLLALYSFEGNSGKALDYTANTYDGTFKGDATQDTVTHPYGAIITGSEGWRLMSAPVSGISYGELLDTLWTQGFTGADHSGGNSNVLVWDESSQSFNSITNATDVPTSGQGFLTFVFDDDNYDGTGDGFPKHILTDSSQFSGETSLNLSFTDSDTLANDGWNLVGNPYGATIDWDATSGLLSENLDATFYVWSDSANSGAGDYLSWNGTTGTFGNGKIAPWQGFWVKANDENPILTLTDKARSAGGILRKQAPISQLNFTLAGETLSSKTILMFSENALLEKDALDAYKLQSLNKDYLSLFTTLEDGSALDINALPISTEESYTIDLDMNSSSLTGTYELAWNPTNLPDGMTLTLVDNETGTEINLSKASSYSFEMEGETNAKTVQTQNVSSPLTLTSPEHKVISPKVMKAKSAGSRFTIKVNSKTSVSNESLVDLPQSVELQQNYPNPFNPSTTIAFGLPESGKVRLEVFDVLGRKVATLINGENKVAGRHTVTFDANNLASGMYIYRLQAGNSIITKKLTLIK